MQLNVKGIISPRKQKTEYSNLFLRLMYKVLRSILFWFDPEWVHYFSMNGLKFLCRIPGIRKLVARSFTPSPDKNIQYSIFNIQFG